MLNFKVCQARMIILTIKILCMSDPLILKAPSKGQHPVYYVLGQTRNGRYLFSVIRKGVKRNRKNTGSGNPDQTIRPGKRRGVSLSQPFLFLYVKFIFVLNHCCILAF
ncbi:MAG: hypothetical protein BWK80_47855 [Desulfobacteraceae bacterium IS3]|nr:MAG: hypothetical protein BWK80_47855 [Desulfobacteraceae bacterium IS3]